MSVVTLQNNTGNEYVLDHEYVLEPNSLLQISEANYTSRPDLRLAVNNLIINALASASSVLAPFPSWVGLSTDAALTVTPRGRASFVRRGR